MNILFTLISIICFIIISATMLARANDLKWRRGINWRVRSVGFALTGTMPLGIVGVWLWSGIGPNFYECGFYIGLAAVFTTTPFLPPWWKWISGKAEEEQR